MDHGVNVNVEGGFLWFIRRYPRKYQDEWDKERAFYWERRENYDELIMHTTLESTQLNLDLMQILLEYGAKFKDDDKSWKVWRIMLSWVASSNNFEMVQLLLKATAKAPDDVDFLLPLNLRRSAEASKQFEF